jgi:hypothetical protein
MVYVALIGNSKTGDNGWIGLYRSDNQGENWINPSGFMPSLCVRECVGCGP